MKSCPCTGLFPMDKQNANTKILTNCHMSKLVNADSIFDKII